MVEILVPIITALSGLGVGAIFTWYFGGRQSHQAGIDNDSHQREKEFFEMVDNRSEKEVEKELRKVMNCAKTCNHSLNCPVLLFWSGEDDK